MSAALGKKDDSSYSGRFARRLRLLREEAGLTVEEVVARIEVVNKSRRNSPKLQTFYSWEQGKATPHMDLLPAIARTLKVTVRELLPEK